MNYQLILASSSPRRQQILREAGYKFIVRTKDTDETIPPQIAVSAAAEFLARKKAAAFEKEINENELVITADTTVVLSSRILGKPADAKEATEMLRMLSGTNHKVITGVCLLSTQKTLSFADTTEVTFRSLTDEEIAFYIENYRPFDKAGSYGIQEWIGMIGITKIAGSYFNVVGLPVEKLYTELRKF